MATDGSAPGSKMNLDGLLNTLSNSVRREVIRYFENQPGDATASLDEVVHYVENQMASKSGEGLWKTLYQVHLPTLERGGWLEFDPESEMISYHGYEEAEQMLREVYEIFKE